MRDGRQRGGTRVDLHQTITPVHRQHDPGTRRSPGYIAIARPDQHQTELKTAAPRPAFFPPSDGMGLTTTKPGGAGPKGLPSRPSMRWVMSPRGGLADSRPGWRRNGFGPRRNEHGPKRNPATGPARGADSRPPRRRVTSFRPCLPCTPMPPPGIAGMADSSSGLSGERPRWSGHGRDRRRVLQRRVTLARVDDAGLTGEVLELAGGGEAPSSRSPTRPGGRRPHPHGRRCRR